MYMRRVNGNSHSALAIILQRDTSRMIEEAVFMLHSLLVIFESNNLRSRGRRDFLENRWMSSRSRMFLLLYFSPVCISINVTTYAVSLRAKIFTYTKTNENVENNFDEERISVEPAIGRRLIRFASNLLPLLCSRKSRNNAVWTRLPQPAGERNGTKPAVVFRHQVCV